MNPVILNVLDFIIDYKTERMNQMQATFSTYTQAANIPVLLFVFRVLLKQYLTCDFKLEIKNRF
jgi:hypothetical protein